jgi:hypothetical protein
LSSLPVIYPAKVDVVNERTDTTDQSENQYESTYALLIRSEEKSRNLLEVALYPLLSLGPLIAIWQFAQQPVNIPPTAFDGPPCLVFDAGAQNNVCSHGPHTRREVRHQEIKG